MRTRHIIAGLSMTLAGISVAQAQMPGHYPPGVEGIKGASAPPPGVYLRDYNLFYAADEIPGVPLTDFKAMAYVNAPRFIWITEKKILGADYGVDLIAPFGWASIEGAGGAMKDVYFGLYDLEISPLILAWHAKQWDIVAAYAVWIPTGETPRPANPTALGKGFFSHMLTLGATWYPDVDKTWALSALNRYELHHEDNGVTMGNSYTVEFGASKNLAKMWDVGMVGYFQGQVTDVAGVPGPQPHSSVFGVGPEVSVAFPKVMTFLSLRWVHEIAAHMRPEGDTVTLTVTKRF